MSLKKLNAAQEEISSYMADNQEATMETIAAALDLDVDAVKGKCTVSMTSPQRSQTPTKEGFQKTADFMYESGMIENELDVNTLFIQ